jgi:hypothetical protein
MVLAAELGNRRLAIVSIGNDARAAYAAPPPISFEKPRREMVVLVMMRLRVEKRNGTIRGA